MVERSPALLRLAMLLLTAASASSCRDAPAPPQLAPTLLRFAPALRFLPDDMPSYWLTDWRHVTGDPDTSPTLSVECGDAFEGPKGAGIGRYSRVRVEDFGELAVPSEPDHGTWALDEPHLGIPVARRTDDDADWSAVVDARFRVFASTRPLLERALSQRTEPQRLLAFLPTSVTPHDDAAHVLVLRPRPAGPTAVTLVEALRAPDRITIWSATEQPEFQASLARTFASHGPTTASNGGVLYEIDRTDEQPNEWLVIALLFGLRVAL